MKISRERRAARKDEHRAPGNVLGVHLCTAADAGERVIDDLSPACWAEVGEH